jgi:hypothetical protein
MSPRVAVAWSEARDAVEPVRMIPVWTNGRYLVKRARSRNAHRAVRFVDSRSVR